MSVWIVQCNEPPRFATDWNVRPIVQAESGQERNVFVISFLSNVVFHCAYLVSDLNVISD